MSTWFIPIGILTVLASFLIVIYALWRPQHNVQAATALYTIAFAFTAYALYTGLQR